MSKAIILGKKVVSRKETLEYAAEKFGWENAIIGISCFFGFWALLLSDLLGFRSVYYCIDFYSPEVPINRKLKNRIFCWLAMQMDKFLVKWCDECWDISERINEGREKFGRYKPSETKVVPLSYPPSYFRFVEFPLMDKFVFVGLDPYGCELSDKIEWIGKGNIPLGALLHNLSYSTIGISIWKEKGNNYYGDPGKTKLYSACGLPVIMTDNTPYAKVIKETQAGIVIPYDKDALEEAINKIVSNYSFYKNNVKKTWEYINADKVCDNLGGW